MDDVLCELEALRAVYADEELTVDSGVPIVVQFCASPRVLPGTDLAFVQATLRFTLTEHYPCTPPSIETTATRGLGEQRRWALLDSLCQLGEELMGETSLLALCEQSRDLLDEMNTPEGNCVVCMCALLSEETGIDDVMICPCYHAFHKVCFGHWWSDQQRQLKLKEDELIEKNGGGCLRLALPKKEKGAYVLHCPVCRAEVTKDDVADELHEESDPTCSDPSWQSGNQGVLEEVLSEEELHSVRSFQAKWKSRFEAQSMTGCFFNESPFVLSLQVSTDEPSQNETLG